MAGEVGFSILADAGGSVAADQAGQGLATGTIDSTKGRVEITKAVARSKASLTVLDLLCGSIAGMLAC